MSTQVKPGQKKDLEKEPKKTSEEPIEEPTVEPPKDLDRLERLINSIDKQNNAILLLTTKMVEIANKVEALGTHQDQTDSAIIEVAKKAGGGGGGAGGNLLTQILPYLQQPRGAGPLEKIAMKSFLENMAFSTLTTRRIAKKAFGGEYDKMVKEMEAELGGSTES